MKFVETSLLRIGYEEWNPDESRTLCGGRGIESGPVLAVPTLVLHGACDTCNHPDSSVGKDSFFTGPSRRELLEGVGHFPQREASQAVSHAILNFLHSHPFTEQS